MKREPSWKAVLKCVLLVLCLAIFSDRARGQDAEATTQSSWRIKLALDAPSLVPPAVQYAVLDADPVPRFVEAVERSRPYYESRLKVAKDAAAKDLVRTIGMALNWDSGFSAVQGDEVHLLTSAPRVSHSLSANTPGGKKWIVTKIVRIKGKPICWSLPIEVKPGETTRVTLTEKNLFELGSTFDEAFAAPADEATEKSD